MTASTNDATFTYDIRYRLDPDPAVRERRLTLADPEPEPGYGPALGIIHHELRRADPDAASMADRAQLAILSMTQVVEA